MTLTTEEHAHQNATLDGAGGEVFGHWSGPYWELRELRNVAQKV